MSATRTPKLSEIPLSRLILLLDATSREQGSDSESAKILAAELQRRLGQSANKSKQKAVRNGRR